MLDAALVTARRHTGWHVSPVIEGDEVVIDGPDSRMLNLPTRKLVELTSVTENDVVVPLADLRWSAGGPPGLLERPATVRKRSSRFWTGHYQGVVVVMDHGYTEEEAADWRRAVLGMVDQMSLVPVTGSTGFSSAGLTSKRVDDVAYGWANPYSVMAEDVLFSVNSVLCDYKLPRVEFI